MYIVRVEYRSDFFSLDNERGCQAPEAVWDVEDEELLAAARRLIATNKDRQSARA